MDTMPFFSFIFDDSDVGELIDPKAQRWLHGESFPRFNSHPQTYTYTIKKH